jgi:membrane protease YdiL (CAAX protease family)
VIRNRLSFIRQRRCKSARCALFPVRRSRTGRPTTAKVLVGAAPVIASLIAPAFLSPSVIETQLGRQFLLLALGAGGILVAELVLLEARIPRALHTLGFAWPRWQAVALAGLISLPMWLFLPIMGWITGTEVGLNAEWPSILLGVILVNGITEEVIHRGFVFGNLRSVSNFWFATGVSAGVFGLQHVYLIFTIGPFPGSMSVLLAIALAVPLALHFEHGGNSVVAPAVLHTSSNAPMMLFVQGEAAATLLMPHMAIVLVSMYFSFLIWRPGPLERAHH